MEDRNRESLRNRFASVWGLAAFLCVSLGGWYYRADAVETFRRALLALGVFFATGWWLGSRAERPAPSVPDEGQEPVKEKKGE